MTTDIRDDSGAFIFLHVGSKIVSDVNELTLEPVTRQYGLI